AVAFGGSLVVLSHLLKHIDRERFDPKVVCSVDGEVARELFAEDDLFHRFSPHFHYAGKERWMARCPSTNRWVLKIWNYFYGVLSLLTNAPAQLVLWRKTRRWMPDLLHINNGSVGLLIARRL